MSCSRHCYTNSKKKILVYFFIFEPIWVGMQNKNKPNHLWLVENSFNFENQNSKVMLRTAQLFEKKVAGISTKTWVTKPNTLSKTLKKT